MMRRAFLAGIALAVISLSIPRATSAADANQVVAQIEQTIQQIRHLKQVGAVKVVFAADAAFDTALRAEFARDNPESEVTLSQREDVTLGLLKPTDSLHKIVYGGLTGQVIGFYDPVSKTLTVRNHLDQALGPERHVIAHEYTHALQDQHYHLKKLLPDQSKVAYRNSDAIGARHALTEGDAVNTELLYIHRTYTPKEIQEVLKIESQPAPTLPMAIQREFNFPYTSGVDFVTSLYRTRGMAAIDNAYRHLPRSTYEIMHPQAYAQGWKPTAVTLHALASVPPGWKQMDDDVFGAYGYQVLLWQYLTKQAATRVTNEYRGDRYIDLQNGPQDALVMKSVWTSHRAAIAARSGLISALKKRFPRARVLSAADATVSQLGGAEFLHVSGPRLTLVYAPTVDLAKQLASTPTT